MKSKFREGNVAMVGDSRVLLTAEHISNMQSGKIQPLGILLDHHSLTKLGFIIHVSKETGMTKYSLQFKGNALTLIYSKTFGYRDSKYDTEFKSIHELQNFVAEVFREELIK
jgi:hypothetical protein